ncbi:hypothetical protein [Mesorhizobium loti]|uniref:Uncharacterized protein n=1 Tax=Rhizobium loti TaxID=381 RepID=A0A6M7TTL0_RHILI|nr:hypothetical protein [Mesorhizobium loti]OBQ65279.1 hypothetical protein A8145_13860 [Mesorhizobium loti]QKC68394.1 hypothetical protein EB815_04120 [Mesorhizobium loti]
MGQLPYRQHWDALVLQSYRSFLQAEDRLPLALADGDNYESACFEALRHAMSGSIFLYHFSDIAAVRNLIPNLVVGNPGTSKQVLQATRQRISDVLRASQMHQQDYHKLLGEAANAVKHGVLDHQTTYVDRSGMVLAIMSVQAQHGEGKLASQPQVVIRAEARGHQPERHFSLRAVMDAVIGAWCGLQLGLSLP